MWYLKCISRKLGDLSLSELLYYNYSTRGDNIIQSSNMVGEYNWCHVNAYLWIFLQRGILAFLSVNLDHYSSFHCAKNISLGFHWKMSETPLTRPPFELTIIQIFFHKYSYFWKKYLKTVFSWLRILGNISFFMEETMSLKTEGSTALIICPSGKVSCWYDQSLHIVTQNCTRC